VKKKLMLLDKINHTPNLNYMSRQSLSLKTLNEGTLSKGVKTEVPSSQTTVLSRLQQMSCHETDIEKKGPFVLMPSQKTTFIRTTSVPCKGLKFAKCISCDYVIVSKKNPMISYQCPECKHKNVEQNF
jgi:hypothetical protein